MKRQPNEPNYSFLVEALTETGERLLMFRIDQVCTNPGWSKCVDNLTNSIEAHLSDLNKRTGLSYGCFAQGPIEEIDKCVQANNIELS